MAEDESNEQQPNVTPSSEEQENKPAPANPDAVNVIQKAIPNPKAENVLKQTRQDRKTENESE